MAENKLKMTFPQSGEVGSGIAGRGCIQPTPGQGKGRSQAWGSARGWGSLVTGAFIKEAMCSSLVPRSTKAALTDRTEAVRGAPDIYSLVPRGHC